MLFFNNIFPLLLTGPNGFGAQTTIEKPCDDYWWTNLLYINNFYPKHMSDEVK